jgi:hypothetical protein
MHGEATILTSDFRSLFLAAILHIHVMRNACFSGIVMTRYVCKDWRVPCAIEGSHPRPERIRNVRH